MKEYKIVPDLMLEEFQKVNEELGSNNYRNFFRKVTNTPDEISLEDKQLIRKEEKKRLSEFQDFCQKLKNLEKGRD